MRWQRNRLHLQLCCCCSAVAAAAVCCCSAVAASVNKANWVVMWDRGQMDRAGLKDSWTPVWQLSLSPTHHGQHGNMVIGVTGSPLKIKCWKRLMTSHPDIDSADWRRCLWGTFSSVCCGFSPLRVVKCRWTVFYYEKAFCSPTVNERL